MNIKEAVDIIEDNWPDERYTMLREALVVVLGQLPTTDNSDYAKCADAIMELLECENNLVRQALKQIIKKHFT